MPMSNYLRNLIRNHVMRDATYSKDTTRYLALCETTPTTSSTGSTLDEPADANYARQSITADDDNWTGATDGHTDNVNDITFGPFDGSVSVTHWAITDHATAGNLLVYGALGSQADATACQSIEIATGDLDITWA